MSGQQDVLQTLIDIVAEIETYEFLAIPTVKTYVIKYLKGVYACLLNEGLLEPTFFDTPDSFWDELAESLIQKLQSDPISYATIVRGIRTTISMDWWVNGKP